MQNTNFNNISENIKKKVIKTEAGVLILSIFLVISCGVVIWTSGIGSAPSNPEQGAVVEGEGPSAGGQQAVAVQNVKKFASEQEFKDYILSSSQNSSYSGGGISQGAVALEKSTAPTSADSAMGGGTSGAAGSNSSASRSSVTNVQVAGIDEPDIVKTDGKEIYYSSQSPIYRLMEDKMVGSSMPSYQSSGQTKLIKALPASDLALDSKIEKGGNLLLDGSVLAVFSDNSIFGYDVKNSKDPQKLWELKLSDQNYIVDSRLYENNIYLVVRNQINQNNPCPIKLLAVDSKEALTISCDQVYHPEVIVPVDSVYSAMIVNARSGKIEKTVSFTGSSGSSLVYMSKEGIYVTYSYTEEPVKFFLGFLNQKAKDLFPARIIEKTGRLEGYDISSGAKMTELNYIFQQYLSSLDGDEQMRIQNEIQNRMSDYSKEKKRELERTGIIKIGLKDFSLSASGDVPGSPLNQFSLDEYNGYLRIAITAGQSGYYWPLGYSSGSAVNDVYVLDGSLKEIGSLTDISKDWNDERIYAVRFIQNQGYIVTFKETDPLSVIDISNPQKPLLAGQLEIPGYSAYLHPLAANRILGVGKEDWKVKLSLFDVGSASDPKEIAKYNLDEYWSEAVDNHRAFLQDEKHQVIFLPGSKGGYIFSYAGDQLKLVKTVSGMNVKRAVYLNDSLYIIGSDGIVVLDENTWGRTGSLEF